MDRSSPVLTVLSNPRAALRDLLRQAREHREGVSNVAFAVEFALVAVGVVWIIFGSAVGLPMTPTNYAVWTLAVGSFFVAGVAAYPPAEGSRAKRLFWSVLALAYIGWALIILTGNYVRFFEIVIGNWNWYFTHVYEPVARLLLFLTS